MRFLAIAVGSMLLVFEGWATSDACIYDPDVWWKSLHDSSLTASTILIARVDSTREEGAAGLDSTFGYFPLFRSTAFLTVEAVLKGHPRTGSLTIHYLTRDTGVCGVYLFRNANVLFFIPASEPLPSSPEDYSLGTGSMS